MGDEATWSSNHDISTHAETLQFLIVAIAVVAAINSHAAHILQVVAEACMAWSICWANSRVGDIMTQLMASFG